MPVLLIIDMQVGMTWPPAEVRNNLQAEANIARLLDAWRRVGGAVVHVRHLSRTPGSPFWPGQPGVEFQPELAPRDDEHVVDKHVPDAFTNTALSAGNLGLRTHVVSDACFTFDKADLRGVVHAAEEVHQMSLANLHGEYATVIDTVAAVRLAGR